MLFFVDYIDGPRVGGWVTLDNPTTVPRFRATIDGRHIDFDANNPRPDILQNGWHTTGQCGFLVNETLVPDIAEAFDVEVRELTTGITIYRRFDPSAQLEKRVGLFDVSVTPQTSMLEALERRFGQSHRMVERHAYDTISSLIINAHSRSILIQGRPSYTRYSSLLLYNQYKLVALLRHPLHEFAERILFGSLVMSNPRFAPLRRGFSGMDAWLEMLGGMPEVTPDAVAKGLKGLSAKDRALLSNPLTRMMACDPDEPAHRNHVPAALDNLASLDVVGTRDHMAEFTRMLEAALSVDFGSALACREFGETARLAAELEKVGIVREMNDLDMVVYASVHAAVEGVVANGRPA